MKDVMKYTKTKYWLIGVLIIIGIGLILCGLGWMVAALWHTMDSIFDGVKYAPNLLELARIAFLVWMLLALPFFLLLSSIATALGEIAKNLKAITFQIARANLLPEELKEEQNDDQ